MSTIKECIDDESVRKVHFRLRTDQQYCRLLLAKPDCYEWLRSELQSATTSGFCEGSASPLEQFSFLARGFIAGDNFDVPQPHEMNPAGEGVWRLRTADIRIVGWFPMHSAFVMSSADLKANCTTTRDNQMYHDAIRFREELGLLDGNFIDGEINDCIRF